VSNENHRKSSRHKPADNIPLFKSSETQTIDDNQKMEINKAFTSLAAATTLAACLEPNPIIPAMLNRFPLPAQA
jgi:hypothetical protein